jgi:hypothetical protein
MDEFAGYHALGCAAHPLSRQFHVFREGCGQYGLTPPLLPVSLPLRSYLYIGSLPVLPFYPFWKVLDDPAAVRVQGSLLLLVAIFLAARLVGASWPHVALAAFVFPLFVGSFLVDTGPVGLQLVMLVGALILLKRAATPGASPIRDAAIAGFLCFLGVWIKLVFVWLVPAVVAYGVWQFLRRPPRIFRLASVAFLACLLAPSAALLLSRDAEGLPYYEVLSVGRFSVEPQSIGTVGVGLFAYVKNGSSLAPRSLFFPSSPLDWLPLVVAAAILVVGLASDRRRDVGAWIAAAGLTFGVTILSGRALASHHLAFTMAFVFLAMASSLAGMARAGLATVGALVGLFWGSLFLRAPTADPHSNHAKDELLSWIRSEGLDRTTVQLHASWGTYYIAHLFGDRDEIVLFARKFAREPDYLAAARDLARTQRRSILLLTCEPERFRPDVVEQHLGPPVAERRFGNWRALEYRPPSSSLGVGM